MHNFSISNSSQSISNSSQPTKSSKPTSKSNALQARRRREVPRYQHKLRWRLLLPRWLNLPICSQHVLKLSKAKD